MAVQPPFLCCHSSSGIYLSAWLSWQAPGQGFLILDRAMSTLLDEGHLIMMRKKRTVKTSTTAWGKRRFGAKSMLDETKVFRDNQPKYTWYTNSSNGETLHQKIWTEIRGGQEHNRKSLCKTKMCWREKGPPRSQRQVCSWFKEKLTFFFPFLIFMIYIFSQSSSNTAHYTLAA